jgi:hypothetical protein
LALRVVTLLIVGGPLAALTAMYWPAAWTSALPAWLISYWPDAGKATFSLVFLFVGLTPVAQKTFNNFTLEITQPENHPRYLSTLSLSMAAPIFASPLVSPLINAVGFEAVYLGVVGLLLGGWLLSFRLIEPRTGGRPIALAEESLD